MHGGGNRQSGFVGHDDPQRAGPALRDCDNAKSKSHSIGGMSS
jgi:hypothetical protein